MIEPARGDNYTSEGEALIQTLVDRVLLDILLALAYCAPCVTSKSSVRCYLERHDHHEVHREIAQEAALFGHGPDVAGYAKGLRLGYLELADGGSLILENIDRLAPRIQKLLVDYLAERRFSRQGETAVRTSRVRIIATLEDIRHQRPGGSLIPELLALLEGEVVRIKPLREEEKGHSLPGRAAPCRIQP